jgi:flagellin-like hook-associated protein FlgL
MKKFSIFLLLLLFGAAISVVANPSLDYLNGILKQAELGTDKNIKRLSGGMRLLQDDPANYAIYQELEAGVRGFEKLIGNNKDIVSYYGFAESLLGNITDALQRVRELVLMKSNPVYLSDDTDAVDSEIREQYDQIVFLLRSSEFNKISVFGNMFDNEVFKKVFTSEPYFNLANVDSMLAFITTQRVFYGTKINQLEYRTRGLSVEKENEQGFQSVIMDVDYGSETSLLVQNHLLFLANILLLKTK